MKPARPRPSEETPPSSDDADNALRRESGCTLAPGPFAPLDRGRWGVPAAAWISRQPVGDQVVVWEAGRWAWVKAKPPEPHEEEDPLRRYDGRLVA